MANNSKKGKGSNPNSHNNKPKIGRVHRITLPDLLWEKAKAIGEGVGAEGVRKALEEYQIEVGMQYSVVTQILINSDGHIEVPNISFTPVIQDPGNWYARFDGDSGDFDPAIAHLDQLCDRLSVDRSPEGKSQFRTAKRLRDWLMKEKSMIQQLQ